MLTGGSGDDSDGGAGDAIWPHLLASLDCARSVCVCMLASVLVLVFLFVLLLLLLLVSLTGCVFVSDRLQMEKARK